MIKQLKKEMSGWTVSGFLNGYPFEGVILYDNNVESRYYEQFFVLQNKYSGDEPHSDYMKQYAGKYQYAWRIGSIGDIRQMASVHLEIYNILSKNGKFEISNKNIKSLLT